MTGRIAGPRDSWQDRELDRVKENAAHLAEIDTNIKWLRDKIEAIAAKGHICGQEQRFTNVEEAADRVGKRIDWSRNFIVTLALAIMGTAAGLGVNCQQQNADQAVTNAQVALHSQAIVELRQEMRDQADAREEDTRVILSKVQDLSNSVRADSASTWLQRLPAEKRRAVTEVVGTKSLPRGFQ